MNAEQMISELRSLPPDVDTANEFMQYLRLGLDHIERRFFDLRLADGSRVNDASDFSRLLCELRDAALNPRSTQVSSEPGNSTATKVTSDYGRLANLEWCPRCGHVHIEDSECGFPIGGGRTCRCEKQVPA